MDHLRKLKKEFETLFSVNMISQLSLQQILVGLIGFVLIKKIINFKRYPTVVCVIDPIQSQFSSSEGRRNSFSVLTNSSGLARGGSRIPLAWASLVLHNAELRVESSSSAVLKPVITEKTKNQVRTLLEFRLLHYL